MAYATFAGIGYAAATVEEIAIRADLAHSVIHYHFSNKRVLWDEVVARNNAVVLRRAVERGLGEIGLLGGLSALFRPTTQADPEGLSAEAFLVISVLESRRNPELKSADHDALKTFRIVISWVVNDAIERGEFVTDIDGEQLVEMLVALVWGMGYYSAFVGADADVASVADTFALFLSGRLWHLHEPSPPARSEGAVPLQAAAASEALSGG